MNLVSSTSFSDFYLLLESLSTQNVSNPLRPIGLRILAREGFLSESIPEALSYLETVRRDYRGTAFELCSLYDLVSYYVGPGENAVRADSIVADMKQRFANEDLTKMARLLVGEKLSTAQANAQVRDSTAQQVLMDSRIEAFPNPFNPSTQIRYSLAEPGKVSLIVYDVLGREITALANEYQQAGQHDVTWNSCQSSGVPASTGLYFARLRVLNDLGGVKFAKTIKLLLTK